MDASINALGGILLKAVPTVVLLLLLHLYLKRVFFKPLEEVLNKRHAATVGAREAADLSLKMAAEKIAQYDAALREARGELYREQEEMRRGWVEAQNSATTEAKAKAKAAMAAAKVEIAAEVATARQELAISSGMLGDQIANALLQGSVN